MNNLYIIAIGGSGERILRSFIMTLAAGVHVNVSKITPVIIENDTKSKALEKCESLINAYNGHGNTPGVYSLYKKAGLTEFPSFCHIEIATPIKLDISGQNLGNLKAVINCPDPQGENDQNYNAIKSICEERDLLFIEEEQNMPIDLGFVGQPHIGTTVINSEALSLKEFSTILQAGDSDGIIILGSLFGGTGAAGIPLVVNKLLQQQKGNKPQIGVVAMLPYFDTKKEAKKEFDALKKNGIKVRPELFDIATRAALMYYAEQEWEIDYMYYIGDDYKSIFEKVDGGEEQDNPATIHELMAANSIIDFANKEKTDRTIYKKPIWGFSDSNGSSDSTALNNSNTSGILNKELRRAVVKFLMMEQVFTHSQIMPQAIKEKWDFVTKTNFTAEKLTSITTDNDIAFKDATGLNFIIKEFNKWLKELKEGNKNTEKIARKLNIFPDRIDNIDADVLATAFYAESEHTGFGLSKWNTHKNIFTREVSYEPIESHILNQIQDAYKKLPQQYTQNLTEDKILAVTLLYVSNALDKVLDKSFNI